MTKTLTRFGEVMRLAMFAMAFFGFVNRASADLLWWTVDFTDGWGFGEPQENPAGEGATDYYVNVYSKVGENSTLIVGDINISGDKTQFSTGGTTSLITITGLDPDAAVFYVEMVKGDGTGYKEYFISEDYSYAYLQASGCIADEITAFDAPFNAGVGTWSVPEPTSGMLVLWGFGLLMLRRKKSDRG